MSGACSCPHTIGPCNCHLSRAQVMQWSPWFLPPFHHNTILMANNGVSFKEEESRVWLYSNRVVLTKASDTSSHTPLGLPWRLMGGEPCSWATQALSPLTVPLFQGKLILFCMRQWGEMNWWHAMTKLTEQSGKSVKSPLGGESGRKELFKWYNIIAGLASGGCCLVCVGKFALL